MRLFDQLSSGSPVVAHLDAKTDNRDFQHPSVTFVAQRVAVHWAGWSMVEATLQLLQTAKTVIKPDDYVVLLSGDSFPLQATGSIASFFEAHSGLNFINCVPMPSETVEKPISRI